MKINVNKHLVKEEETNKTSYKSASKSTDIQPDFSKSEGRNSEFSSKEYDTEKVFYLLNRNNKKINQINQKSRNIINTQPCESSLKLFSFRRKYTDFYENFNTSCLKKSVMSNKNKNQLRRNVLTHSCCSLKEFRRNIIIDYTNNYLKKSKDSKTKSVRVYDYIKNCIDDTASSTNNFNNSGLLYKRRKKNNNSCYISNKAIKKIINVNLKTEKGKKTNRNNSMYLDNKTNISVNKKINKNIIRNNFKPHSNLELYINKNDPKINLINTNQLSTKCSKYLNPISRNTDRGEMSPIKNYENNINLHTEKKISVKKQKSNKIAFNVSSIYDNNANKKTNKKYNNKFSNNNSIIKSSRKRRKNNSQITLNKKSINKQGNKSELVDQNGDFTSVEEIHFAFVKIAQKQKMFFQSKSGCNH